MNLRKLIVGLAGLLLLAGCEQEDQYALRFNHQTHVEGMELECSYCHGELSEGELKSPDHDVCIDCHEDLIDADEISAETCGVCHIEKDLDTIGEESVEIVATKGVFQHTVDLEGKCSLCHAPMLETEEALLKEIGRSDVVSMREKAHATGMACQTCHADLAKDQMPASHLQNWTRRHGLFASEQDATCGVCHAQQSCRECHQAQAPQSHTNQFRLRTHGMEANWARERCMVCHQEDSCESCHQGIRPRSHTAAWRQRHCIQCHSSSSMDSGCATCHKGGINVHENLTVPAWHAGFSPNLCLNSGCHNPVDGNPAVRLVPSQHPFLDTAQCYNCHRQ